MATDSIASIPEGDDRTRILNRLKRLEGQIRGVRGMIESGQECDSVLTQVSAARSALSQVSLLIVGHAMRNCVTTDKDATQEEIVDEAVRTFLRYSSCVK